MLATLLTVAITIAATTALPVTWLDATRLVNWNTARITLPARPGAADPELANGGRCAATARPATSPEDRLVRARGWTLAGPYQRFGRTSIVSAMAGADGMCRPMGYQSFVFVNGAFAGTLSPKPMDARTDSSIQSLSIAMYDADEFSVDYSRYSPDDPLCCPSATTNVTFQITSAGGHARVVPQSATTQKNPQ